MTDRELMEQALEALEDIGDEWGFTSKRTLPKRSEAITALRKRLAQPEQPAKIDIDYWVSSRPQIIEAVAKAGYTLMSNANGFWLELAPQPERHELQAKGEHPAPCARHCEATAFQIVINNLKAQLAQPEQEPVANIRIWHKNGEQHAELWNWDKGIETLPDGNYDLYTTPPQRKPLTDEEIDELSRSMVKGDKSVNWLCRAIEAAHGIKGQA